MTTTGSYADVRRGEFMRLFARNMPLASLENIQAAYAFSKGAHRNQMRDDGTTRYFEHCKSVAWIIAHELGITGDWEIIVDALLHDAKEDSFLLSAERIELNFGRNVRQDIDDLSKFPGEEHSAYLARMEEPAVSWRVIIVKLADRLQNLRTLGSCTLEKQTRKRAETLELYVPFIDRCITEWRGDTHTLTAVRMLHLCIQGECFQPTP